MYFFFVSTLILSLIKCLLQINKTNMILFFFFLIFFRWPVLLRKLILTAIFKFVMNVQSRRLPSFLFYLVSIQFYSSVIRALHLFSLFENRLGPNAFFFILIDWLEFLTFFLILLGAIRVYFSNSLLCYFLSSHFITRFIWVQPLVSF